MSATGSDPAALNPKVRLAYIGHLGLVVLAVAAAALAAGSGDARCALAAVLSVICAWMVRSRLSTDGMLAACAAEDDVPVAMFARDAATASHEAALQHWRKLEAQRGNPGFDPWECLAARRALDVAKPARD